MDLGKLKLFAIPACAERAEQEIFYESIKLEYFVL